MRTPLPMQRTPEDEAHALLARAHTVTLAISAAKAHGPPILRTVAAKLVGGSLLLRAGAADHGRRVVISAHEHLVSIDATTYFTSAQAEGVVEPSAGGGDEPRSGAGDGFHARIALDRVSFVAELGREAPLAARQRVLESLWRRGAPGDVDAVAFVLGRFPELGTPSFLRPSADVDDRGFTLQCGLGAHEIDDVLDLLQGLYWLSGVPRADIRAAVLASTAVVVARDTEHRIVACARAVSDGKCAWIYDVAVAEHLRGARLGSAVMGVLLDHPAVRGVRHVRLTTRDAMPFYRRLGFRDLVEAPRYAWTSTEMIRPGSPRPERARRTGRTRRTGSERAAEPEPGRAVAEQRVETRLGELGRRS